MHIVLYILPQMEHTGPRLAALVYLQGHKTCECALPFRTLTCFMFYVFMACIYVYVHVYMYVYLYTGYWATAGKPWSMTMLYILTCIYCHGEDVQHTAADRVLLWWS